MIKENIFSSKKTAILIDLSFFLKMYCKSQGNYFSEKELAQRIKDYAFKSLKVYNDTLFKIYVYDCPPITGRIKAPISKTDIYFHQTKQYNFRINLLKELNRQPYFATRLGEIKINKENPWVIKPKILKQILCQQKTVESLTDQDFALNLRQKGVDIKIALDIAKLSLRKDVEKIILMTGDSDFIPAIKLARREGIIIHLDPLRHNVSEDMLDHIDLLYSILPNYDSL
ncbi:NYN domain-containing protein [Campylobacter lari]|nr:NYN domain-containing protein [Campylobacter lari]